MVAFVLAVALGMTILLILVTAVIIIVDREAPTPSLGENTTQVLTSAVGGVVGILGAYIGYSFRGRPRNNGEDQDEEAPL